MAFCARRGAQMEEGAHRRPSCGGAVARAASRARPTRRAATPPPVGRINLSRQRFPRPRKGGSS